MLGPAVLIGDDCSRGPGRGEWTLPPRFKGPGLGSADTCQRDLNAEALSWTLSRRLEAASEARSSPSRPGHPVARRSLASPHGPGGPQSWDASPGQLIATSRLFLYLCTDTFSNVTVSRSLGGQNKQMNVEGSGTLGPMSTRASYSTAGRSSAQHKAIISTSVPTRRQGSVPARGPHGSAHSSLCPPISSGLTPASHARCSPASNVLLYDHGR